MTLRTLVGQNKEGSQNMGIENAEEIGNGQGEMEEYCLCGDELV